MSKSLILNGATMSVRLIIDSSSSIVTYIHKAISLIVVDSVDGAVYGDHFEVRSESVALSVPVRENSGLKNSVI